MTMTKKSIFAFALCSLLFASCTIDNTVNDKPISKPDTGGGASGPVVVNLFGYFKANGGAWGDATFTKNGDGSVTYAGSQWSGYALGLYDWDGNLLYPGLNDLSGYSKFVVEFASATTVPCQVVLNGNPPVNEWGQVGGAWADAGSTKLEMSFDGVNVSDLNTYAIQLAADGSIDIKDIYIVGK